MTCRPARDAAGVSTGGRVQKPPPVSPAALELRSPQVAPHDVDLLLVRVPGRLDLGAPPEMFTTTPW